MQSPSIFKFKINMFNNNSLCETNRLNEVGKYHRPAEQLEDSKFKICL